MAIRAPWKGWLRVGMPTVSFLILANTFAICTLATLNAAALDLFPSDGDNADARSYVQDNQPSLRAQLVFFWCTLPALLLILTFSEHIYLWNDKLFPIWILCSSIFSICAWITQLILWQLCLHPTHAASTPGYCPYVYKGEGWGRYATWYHASPSDAGWAVSTLLILHLVQMGFAAKVIYRQRRTTFRKSDMRNALPRELEEGGSRFTLISTRSSRSMSDSDRTETERGRRASEMSHMSTASTRSLGSWDDGYRGYHQ